MKPGATEFTVMPNGPSSCASFLDRIAMRRMGTPEDIAHAVLFLASDYASWITGQILPVMGSPVA